MRSGGKKVSGSVTFPFLCAEENAAIVVSAGILEPLVALVSRGKTDKVKQAALLVLGRFVAGHKPKLLEAGLMDVLKQAQQQDTIRVLADKLQAALQQQTDSSDKKTDSSDEKQDAKTQEEGSTGS